ncbi:P-loop NTPase fold protein [Priestia koreensis]|uniref:P-loop NTPase fold protein n=1 Tax=Priestia koreensis TaxID=284581 RepID=UPI003016D4CF
MKANEIINVLNKFRDSIYYQKILINGSWGIGKTKFVSDFIKTHSNVCYISLFGKKDIDSIVQEIYFKIIENVEYGSFKKTSQVLRDKLKNINFRLPGVSISVPLIGNIYTTLYSELENKDTFIVIFDDLERKHHHLDIKEIFGLVDSLSKLDNLKTVLIAATEQFKEDDEKTFKSYQEKAVDRTYTINSYAENAPVEILGKEVWGVISKHTENIKFDNLRTFEKTNLFIREVTDELDRFFTDKFTKNDIYRICFAVILFNVEHKKEMVLLEKDETKESNFNVSYYSSGDAGVIEYLCNYILKNSLDNVMSKNIFSHIIKWYESGVFSEDILTIISSINSYEEKPRNFFSSEEDIIRVIEHCREFIKTLKGDEQIEDITSKLSTAFSWCELLEIDFGMNNNEILDIIKGNISNRIDLQKTLHENKIDTFFYVESEHARHLIFSINEAIREEYQIQLLQKIKNNFVGNSYKLIYLRDLTDLVRTSSSQPIRDFLLKSLDENQYFFPIPSGRITEDLWYWCHQVNILIRDIEHRWEIENFYSDFKDKINALAVDEDKLLKHRLKTLFER